MPSKWPKPGDPDYKPGFVTDKIRRRAEVGFSRDMLTRIARDKLEEIKSKQTVVDLAGLRLMDLIPAVSQNLPEPLDKPEWLLPIVNVFERAILEGGVRAVLATPPQHGKAVADDTPMLTRGGWVPAGKVVVGDELVGSDGKWTRVLAVHPQGTVPLFRVTFTDGSSLVTCAEHRWLVSERDAVRPEIKTTAYLAGDHTICEGVRANGTKKNRHKWRIPVVKPLEGEDVDLPVDPYLLGCWLGDGTTVSGQITSADPEIVGAFTACGFALGASHSRGLARTYSVLGLRAQLRAAGVFGNKHIPHVYFRAPVEQRLAVLQGLCDTDGTVAKNGSQQSYCSTNPRLASDFKLLVNSLGGVCTDLTRPAADKVAHNIYFRLPEGMSGFRLDRKRSRLNAYNARTVPRRLVASVEPAGEGPATCFTVEAVDHLFCAGRDLIVTHNSTVVQNALIRAAILGLNPNSKLPRRHAYVTYNQERHEKVSREFQKLAEAAGLEPDGRLSEVTLKGGTEVRFTSIGGSLTGNPVDGLLIIDDPHKDRKEAESPTIRMHVCDWFSDVARSRRHASTSIVVIATRWHPEDLSGDRIRAGYPYINLKAIAEGQLDGEGRVIGDPLRRRPGESLWFKKPPEFFQEEQRDAYTWNSLYQGEPRGRGNAVFTWPDLAVDSLWYDPETLPPRNRIRVSVGCDFAYTSKTYADHSCAVVLGQYQGKTYVLNVVRTQEETRLFRSRLELIRSEWPDADFCAFVNGPERGGAEFVREAGLPIRALSAQRAGDKFTRSLPVAAGWNTGRILLPKNAGWLDPFLNEICSFTGVKDRHDDQVDAMGAAWAGLGGDDDDVTIGTPTRRRGW